MNSIILELIYIAKRFFVSLYNMTIPNILTFILNNHMFLLLVFMFSLIIYFIQYGMQNIKKDKYIPYTPIRVDELASNTYYNLFKILKNKNFEALSEICELELIKKIKGLNLSKFSLPLYTDVKIDRYDNQEGIICVTCTGFFLDNSISKHFLTFKRTKSENYLLSDIGGIK